MMKTDMNPHSITMRIKKSSELRRLCISLGGDRLKEKLHDDQIRTKVLCERHKPADKSKS
jgi:hypothetical protein